MARTGRLSDQTIGQRVHSIRIAHPGWSLRVVAGRAGISKSTLSAIEHGERSVNNRYLVADLAAALECSVTDITGEPYVSGDRVLERAHTGVSRLRAAITNAALDEPAADTHRPRAVETLAGLVDSIDERPAVGDYAGVVELAPGVLADLHAHVAAGNRRALRLMLPVCYASTFAFKQLGYPGDGVMAAYLGRQVAGELGDPVLSSYAEFALVHATASTSGYRRAGTLAARALAGIEQHLDAPGALAMAGMLHLSQTHTSMAQKRPDDALTHLGEAREISARTGETNTFQLSFGPANVAVWEVGIRADRCDVGIGDRVARTAVIDGLPSSRQAQFWLDRGRTLAHLPARHDQAVRALLTAERLAPQHVRSSPAARETARDIAETARRNAVGSNLRGFCERVGVHL